MNLFSAALSVSLCALNASISHPVFVCITGLHLSLKQSGLSSRDNQGLALVKQPSEAERGKAETTGHCCVCVPQR